MSQSNPPSNANQLQKRLSGVLALSLATAVLAIVLGFMSVNLASAGKYGTGWVSALIVAVLISSIICAISVGYLLARQESTIHESWQNPNATDITGSLAAEDGGSTGPWIYLAALGAAVFLDLEVLPALAATRLKTLWEHLIIALFVAAALGITLDLIIDRRRDKQMRAYLRTLYQDFARRLETTYALIRPEHVFRLMKEIVVQTTQTPTLYRPPRKQHDEYNFASNLEYFDMVVNIRRKEIVEVLRGWLRDAQGNPNLKFLASDFIGRYYFRELEDELRTEVGVQRAIWGELNEKDKSWVMNYIWAYSRFECPRYKSLGEFLRSQDDVWVKKWILFVPRQMKDPEFVPMIKEYLAHERAHGGRLGPELKCEVETTLSILDEAGMCSAHEIKEEYSQLFA